MKQYNPVLKPKFFQSPLIKCGSTSRNVNSKLDTASLVQKTYSKTDYIESIVAEEIDMKERHKNINSPDPLILRIFLQKSKLMLSLTIRP